jgi:hypothetical protein
MGQAKTAEAELARRRAISEAKKGISPSLAHRAAIGVALKGRVAPNKGKSPSVATREKLRQAGLKQAEEGRINTSGLTLGTTRTKRERSACWTPEKRAAQSLKTTQAYRDSRMQVHGRYRGVWTLYDGPKGQINMRSKSEALFAHSLDAQGIDWQYEPQRFDLGWATYLPDFYLPAFDRWIEVKGSWNETSQRKFDEFSHGRLASAVLAQDILKML